MNFCLSLRCQKILSTPMLNRDAVYNIIARSAKDMDNGYYQTHKGPWSYPPIYSLEEILAWTKEKYGITLKEEDNEKTIEIQYGFYYFFQIMHTEYFNESLLALYKSCPFFYLKKYCCIIKLISYNPTFFKPIEGKPSFNIDNFIKELKRLDESKNLSLDTTSQWMLNLYEKLSSGYLDGFIPAMFTAKELVLDYKKKQVLQSNTFGLTRKDWMNLQGKEMQLIIPTTIMKSRKEISEEFPLNEFEIIDTNQGPMNLKLEDIKAVPE